MKYWADLLFLGGFITTPSALAAVLGETPITTPTAKEVVRDFLHHVRSGKAPEQSSKYLADTILAHQMNSENESTVERTPSDYGEHVKDFKRIYGDFDFEITELIAENDRVYARWKQIGCHIGPVDGRAPSGLPVMEVASAVYRVQEGKIVEYWIQIDRKGMQAQMEQNAGNGDGKIRCLR